MTDAEIVRACAEAMEIPVFEDAELEGRFYSHLDGDSYDPFHDNAQVMALAFRLAQRGVLSVGARHVLFSHGDHWGHWVNYDGTEEGFRRAICECVARLHAKKATA